MAEPWIEAVGVSVRESKSRARAGAQKTNVRNGQRFKRAKMGAQKNIRSGKRAEAYQGTRFV
jgi:hypothetical protein